MLAMNLRSVSSALFLLGAPLVASQFELTCDTGPDAFVDYGKNIPQTCIDVPFDGGVKERCFYTYVPESCSPEEITKAPLVLDVHGQGSCALWSAGYTGWLQKAEEECIVVVWPDGTPNVFSGQCFDTPGFLMSSEIPGAEDSDNEVATLPCCCLSMDMMPGTETIDPIFLKMAIDTTVESLESDESLSIDTDRIYMAGHSNGCIMSLAMAALYSDTIAAVCCHAGALVTRFPDDYGPVPIWLVLGIEDATIPYEGGTLITIPGIGALGFLSMDQTMSYLNDKNECKDSEETDLEDETGVVGTIVKNTNCKNGASVEIVSLIGVDHFPYKGGNLGETDVDTTSMAWEFCSSYSKAEPIVAEEPEEDVDVVEEEEEEEVDVVEEEDVEVETETDGDANESSAYYTASMSFSMVLALSVFLGFVSAM